MILRGEVAREVFSPLLVILFVGCTADGEFGMPSGSAPTESGTGNVCNCNCNCRKNTGAGTSATTRVSAEGGAGNASLTTRATGASTRVASATTSGGTRARDDDDASQSVGGTPNVNQGGSTSSTRRTACTDQPRPSESCADAVAWGFCSQAWFAGNCEASCGICSLGTSSATSGTRNTAATGAVGAGGSGGTSTTNAAAPSGRGGTQTVGTNTTARTNATTAATAGPTAAGGAATLNTTNSPATISTAKFVGNITTGNSIDAGGMSFAKHWNQITPENAGKWGSVQSSAGSNFSWSSLDAIYDYAQKNNVIFKQHTFIWGRQQPGGTINEASVKEWMSAFCTRYPNTKLIDVVNEPPPHTTPAYANDIGGGTNGTWTWIVNAFKWARAACPNAILILNDFNNIEWSSDASHFIDIVKTAKAAGAPIDAVGAQAHDLDHSSVSVSTVKSLLAQLNGETGLPVYITELDIDTTDDARQLSLYQQYLPYFLETSYVKGITIWGWIFGSTWSSAPNSGLVRNGSARPAMNYIMQLLGRPTP